MQTKDPKPEIMRLEELALLVKTGEIKLPRFQRPFVWKAPDMLKLLDSIYKGYPIGSILIWNSSQKLISERSISGFDVNVDNSNNYPTNYLLDGQQRLTTLCGALFWAGKEPNSLWDIQFDLDKEEFIHPKESNQVNVFPLNKLIQTSDFIRQCMKFEHHEKKDKYFQVSERLLKSIKDYKIAVVKIGDMTLEEVAPIFERINSTGRKLTIVDLMMAATWSDGFDLTSEIQRIKDACREVGFDDIGDQVILRTISASADLGVNKDDIQKLRAKNAEELSSAAASASKSLVTAIEFLRNRIDIHDFSYVPYAFQITYLAEFFRLSTSPSEQQLQHLTEWFWFTSATRYFGTFSNTGQVTKDFGQIRNFASGKISRLFSAEEIDISRLLFDKFNLRTASSTTFTLLLNSKNPENTIDGRSIDGSHLKIKSNRFFASYAPINGQLEKLNLGRIIYPYSDSEFSLVSKKSLVDLDLHLLDEQCINYKNEANSAGFIASRAALVAKLIESLTGCSVRFMPTTNSNVDDEFDIE